MKTQEELNALKKEVKTMRDKLAELSEEELAGVIGGAGNFSGSFTKSITLISASLFGKSVNVNEVLTAAPPDERPET